MPASVVTIPEGGGDGGGGGGGGGGVAGGGDGGDGLGGEGGGGGEGGEDGEGGPQQASLQFAESFFFFLWHKFVHFSRFPPPLHALFTCFWSHFLHVFLSLSAWQFFGDGLGAVTLRLISRPFAMNDSGRTESNETEDGGA